MKTTDGFHYAYNAQAVVDEESQVVLAHAVTNQAADAAQLIAMIGATEANLDAADIDDSPDRLLADAGYCSEDNVTDATDAGVDVLIATGRIKHGERVPDAPRGPIPKDATVKVNDGPQAADQAGTDRLRQTQGHRRAGLRTDEGPTSSRIPPSARVGRCPG